ncbi:restriction endonuclease subunit S [Lactobacillus jensenii]|nr:restriction endonuclease subunit S [Lactobacillus jensenii]MBQ4670024.1 restriction endonuclease subunit S [Lactobacillus jensenii]MBW8449194.1 restriction endonuclease subunit S [Lactobacillus jensenii]MDK7162113.1 restriction endonuclease subunit S [Lactobacillus jensenii]MDK7309882.1 restriction endonuclease subunit S [Lactobacillus jensenii]MDK7319065.1 restriction endonuclease subunit S [Lactobacillus jensenii]
MYPKVRFRGFDEPWKKVKLGEISEKITQKNNNSCSQFPVLTNSAEYGIVYQKDFFDKNIAINTDNYYVVHTEDFVYNPRISKQAPYGPIRVNHLKTGVMSPLYYIFKIKDDFNIGFFEFLFIGNKWHKFMYQNGDSGARSDRYAIKDKVFNKLPIYIPQKIEEQKLIFEINHKINSLLYLQHRKMELENQTSKAIYNYLFDKNKPFYFKDNKTKKVFLKELGTTYSGLSGKNKTDFGHGKAKYITYLNVNKNTIANHNLLDLIEIDKKQNEVLNGDILFTISSETPEEVGLASLWPYDDTNIYLNSFCFGFRPNSKINNLWLAYELRSLKIRKNMYKLAQGISRYNLSKKSVLNLQVDVPSDAEQNFDSKFVKLINIQTKFLSNERNELLLLKKFLLQNLFI